MPHESRWGGGRAAAHQTIPRQVADLPFDRYSRRVALLKRILPAIGGALVLLVVAWPRLSPLLDRVRLSFPAIDLRAGRQLAMINPRYAGVDRQNHPFVVTAAVAHQIPNQPDLVSLERPRADISLQHGGVVATAASGVYQSQAQLLDLFNDITLVRADGTRFVTSRARLNLASNTAEGHDPIEGHGPSGDIAAQGFRMLDKGEDILFTGKSTLVLKESKATVKPAPPPAVPARVARTAARVEAAERPALARAAHKAATARELHRAAVHRVRKAKGAVRSHRHVRTRTHHAGSLHRVTRRHYRRKAHKAVPARHPGRSHAASG